MSLRKKFVFALFAAISGFGSAVYASDPCIECDQVFWQCGGYQNDHCTMRYEQCLRRNGCPGLFD